MAIPKGRVKALKLRPVKNDLPCGMPYCGPSVLSSITGRKVSVINELIREQRYGSKRERRARFGGKGTGPAVRSVWPPEMASVLAHYGLRMRQMHWDYPLNRLTLAAWLPQRPDRNALYVVLVTGHWVAVKGNKFVDSRAQKTAWLSDAPGRRKRVRAAWVVTHRK